MARVTRRFLCGPEERLPAAVASPAPTAEAVNTSRDRPPWQLTVHVPSKQDGASRREDTSLLRQCRSFTDWLEMSECRRPAPLLGWQWPGCSVWARSFRLDKLYLPDEIAGGGTQRFNSNLRSRRSRSISWMRSSPAIAPRALSSTRRSLASMPSCVKRSKSARPMMPQ
jgi:hypothetical protein